MSGAGRHEAARAAGGRWWRRAAGAVMWPWQLPGRQHAARQPRSVAGLGLDRQVIATRLARLEACEEQLAAVRARLAQYDAAWAAMRSLPASGCDDGHRHGMHVVPRELPG